MNIGIGITTYNRRGVANKTVAEVLKYAPYGAKVVVVDDGSGIPFKSTDVEVFRFKDNVGIAGAKNKCLELLDKNDYIFLFDDDCYPKKEDWHLPYIKSGQEHLSYTWHRLANGRYNNNKFLHLDIENGLKVYKSPCGVMLYLTKKVIDTIGGFDQRFKSWGYEHVEFSKRVYNAGLTKYPFADLINSYELFHALDFYTKAPSSADKSYINYNKHLWLQESSSSQFKPYK